MLLSCIERDIHSYRKKTQRNNLLFSDEFTSDEKLASGENEEDISFIGVDCVRNLSSSRSAGVPSRLLKKTYDQI